MNDKLQPMRTPEQHCLVQAMTAKDKIFRAQDAADRIDDNARRLRARQLLDCARADLEAIDRLLREIAISSIL